MCTQAISWGEINNEEIFKVQAAHGIEVSLSCSCLACLWLNIEKTFVELPYAIFFFSELGLLLGKLGEFC